MKRFRKSWKVILALFLSCNFLPISLLQAQTKRDFPTLRSEYVIVKNQNDDRVLYEKSAKEKMYPASMTKLMTALVAMDQITNLEERVIITEVMIEGLYEANASVAGFEKGESISYQDLLYGLLLPSGADAANAFVFSLCENEESFVQKMNEKAATLGMKETHFMNATGLHDENHYSTASDMLLLLEAAIQNEIIRNVMESKSYDCESSDLTFTNTITKMANTAGMDASLISGGKTGFTWEAGECLASYARQNGETILMVSAQTHSDSYYPYHIEDALKIYQYLFSQYERKRIYQKGDKIVTTPIAYGKVKEYTFFAKEDISAFIEKGEDTISTQLSLYEPICAPVAMDTVVGTILIYQGDVKIAEWDALIEETIDKDYIAYYFDHPYLFFVDFRYLFVLCLLACFVGYSGYLLKKFQNKERW